MRSIFKMYIVTILLFLSQTIWAQSYVPKEGETFFFYPVASSIRDSIDGFDCIYSTELAYKKGKIKIKPSFRFKVDEKGYTPLSEIEGHRFTMISSIVENKDEKRVEKKTYVCFLKREDGLELFFRIPYVRRTEDNKLTQAMTLYFNSTYGKRLLKINMPCCPVKTYNEITEYFTGEKITTYSRTGEKITTYMHKSSGFDKACALIEKQTTFLGGFIPQNLFSKQGHDLFCDSIGFRDVTSYVFKQPVAYCKYGERNVVLPIFEFRGVGNCSYGDGFSILNHFERRTYVYNHLMEGKNFNSKILSLPGKRLRYDGTEYAQLDYNQREQIRYLKEDKQYFLKAQRAYLCERLDITNEFCANLELCAVMKDSLGNEFQIPLFLIDLMDNQNSFTHHKFELEEEYIARQKTWQEEKAAEDAAFNAKIAQYKTQYKDNDLAFSLAIGKCTEERYLNLRKKYGVRKAGLMARGLYEIGWSYNEVKESIGDAYFECVHTYENRYGYYERYQHREYAPSYLLFENGRLISIYD